MIDFLILYLVPFCIGMIVNLTMFNGTLLSALINGAFTVVVSNILRVVFIKYKIYPYHKS